MSVPRPPDPAKLVLSVVMTDKQRFDTLYGDLERVGGAVDLVSRWFDFDFTDYYYREMGRPLFRRMLAFQSLIDPGRLPAVKHAVNGVEDRFREAGNRRVNIDPGYLLPARFVLATGKDYAHRIYIGHHIYADLTLLYAKQGFQPLPWTYPDYAGEEITRFLTQVRGKYLLDLKAVKRMTQ